VRVEPNTTHKCKGGTDSLSARDVVGKGERIAAGFT
jgi:hypothetical protein